MTRIRPAYAYAILAAVILLFMGRLIVCDFTWWDDPDTIHQNPMMNPVQWDTFVHNWTAPSMEIYIPLTYTLWAFLAIIGRVQSGEFGITLNPYVFHAANVLVHTLGAFAAWQLLRRLVKNDTAALLGALLWAVHPVQVESVGWVSGLKDVLAGSLALMSLWQYVRWRQDDKRHAYWIALLLYVLATLSKPSAMTVPLMMIAIDWLALHTSWRKIARGVLLFAIVTLPIALIARSAQPAIALRYNPLLGPLIAGDSLAFYLVKLVAPIHLTFDYSHSPASILRSGEIWYAWLLPAVVFGMIFGIYLRNRSRGHVLAPLHLLACVLFVLAPLPVLGLTKFDFELKSTTADHYLYLAMIGPALLFAWAMSRWQRPLLIPAILVLALLGTRTMFQDPVWQDERSLMTHTLQVNPRSWTAYLNLASYWSKHGSFSNEYTDLQKAAELNPDETLIQIGLMAANLQRHDYAVADKHAQNVIRIYDAFWGKDIDQTIPGFVSVITTYVTAGRLDDAERYIKAGLARNPTDGRLLYWQERVHRLQLNAKAQATPAPTSRANP